MNEDKAASSQIFVNSGVSTQNGGDIHQPDAAFMEGEAARKVMDTPAYQRDSYCEEEVVD